MKRGIEKTTLIALVLLLVGVLVMWPVISNATTIGQGFVDGGVCGASAALSSIRFSQLCGFIAVDSPTALRCEKTHVQITNEEVSVSKGGSQETISLSNNQQQRDEQIATVFAEEMRSCWQTFGKGQVQLFSEGYEIEWLEWGDDKVACHICSEIVFLEEVNTQGILLNQRLEQPMVGSQKTYIDFFNNPQAKCQNRHREGEGCWSSVQEQILTEKDATIGRINTEQAYAVVMARQGYGICSDSEENKLYTNFVHVMPHDKLNTVCETIVI